MSIDTIMCAAGSTHGRMANAHRILVTEREEALGSPKCRWEDNIKMDVKETV
jgi:hypothetical protein